MEQVNPFRYSLLTGGNPARSLREPHPTIHKLSFAKGIFTVLLAELNLLPEHPGTKNWATMGSIEAAAHQQIERTVEEVTQSYATDGIIRP